MTPAEKITNALADWHPAGPGPHVTRVDMGGATLTLTADRADELSCRLTELAVNFAVAPAVGLADWAVRAAERVTGQSDRLAIYEVDTVQQVAKLRSAAPAERAGAVSYFELTLAGRGAASMKRFNSAIETGGRQPAPFALTHESVVTVVEGLLASAKG